MLKFKPTDLIALTIIVGYIYLASFKQQTILSSSVILVVGFYFGAEHQKKKDKE